MIAGAQVRSVPLVEVSISSTNWSEPFVKVIRNRNDDPRLPVKPNRAMRGTGVLEKVVALAKRYDVLVVHDLA